MLLLMLLSDAAGHSGNVSQPQGRRGERLRAAQARQLRTKAKAAQDSSSRRLFHQDNGGTDGAQPVSSSSMLILRSWPIDGCVAQGGMAGGEWAHVRA